jgi:hypothetical protein
MPKGVYPRPSQAPLPVTKTCAMCGETKPITMYGAKNGAGLKARCRACLAEQQRQYLRGARDDYNASRRAETAKNRALREEAKRHYREQHADEIRLAEAERAEQRRLRENEMKRTYYAANKARFLESNRRSRTKHADAVADRQRRWKAANHDRVIESNIRWLAANAERMRVARLAKSRVRDAIRSGRLVRPTTCEWCGVTGIPIEAAHADYARPLDVRWLCRRCHRRWDAREPKTTHPTT